MYTYNRLQKRQENCLLLFTDTLEDNRILMKHWITAKVAKKESTVSMREVDFVVALIY